MKSQMVVDKKGALVIATSFANGKKHDFRLFKESKTGVHPQINILTDSGYLGINKIHQNSSQPKKKSKKKPLTKEEKRGNSELSSRRVLNEHVISRVKKFRIVGDRYRNRRKRFGLRFNLICGVYNYEQKQRAL